jgi:threonine/homoserine/homoserine lactone efflux protein
LLEYFLSGALLGLTAGISPGPILALVIAHTLRYGRREGIKVACAPLLSDPPIVAATLFLLARISDSRVPMGVVSIAGAIFLAALGWESVRGAPAEAAADGAEPRSLAKAVALNLLNPHVYLFWATVGAPMVLRGWAVDPARPAAFLAAFYLGLVGSKAVLAVLLGNARNLLAGNSYRVILRLLGAAMFVLAGWLFVQGLRRLGFAWS